MLTSLLEQERGTASDQKLWVAARKRPSRRNPAPGCFSGREKLSPAIARRLIEASGVLLVGRTAREQVKRDRDRQDRTGSST